MAEDRGISLDPALIKNEHDRPAVFRLYGYTDTSEQEYLVAFPEDLIEDIASEMTSCGCRLGFGEAFGESQRR